METLLAGDARGEEAAGERKKERKPPYLALSPYQTQAGYRPAHLSYLERKGEHR